MPRAAAQTLDCAKIALFVDWFAQKLDAREIWKCLEHQLRTIEVTIRGVLHSAVQPFSCSASVVRIFKN